MKDHSISVDQNRYATSIVAKNIDTATVRKTRNVYKTILPSDMIFTNDSVSISEEKVEKLTRELKICYRACIGSLSYLFL